MTRGGGGLDISVYPSGSARNTASAPMLPAAPGRLSTITGWPHFSLNFSATMRGIRSALPPAGNGTTMRTGFPGHSCACTAVASITAAANRSLMPSSEPPEERCVQHVVGVGSVERGVASYLLVALPVEAHAEAAQHGEVPFQPRAIGKVAIRMVVDAAYRSIKSSAIDAGAQKGGQVVGEFQDAEAGEIH